MLFFRAFGLNLGKQTNMKHFILIFAALAIFASCKRNNGYTCDVYAKKTQYFEARKLGIEEFESRRYMELEGPEIWAISKYNDKHLSTSIQADSATCKTTHINKR